MATLRKRGNSQWQCQVRKTGFPTVTKTFDTSDEAKAWATVIESEMLRGVFVDRSEAEKTTLKEALERYRDEITVTKKGEVQEKTKIGKLLRHPLASRTLASIQSTDLSKFRDEMINDGLSASTATKYLALISHLYTIAIKEWRMGVQNPVATIRKPKAEDGRDRRLMEGEEDKLMAALTSAATGSGVTTKAGKDFTWKIKNPNLWIEPMARLAIETAMREGELLKLKWSDVNLVKCTALARDTKNGDKIRLIPLSSRAVAILSALPRSIDGRVFPTTQQAVVQSFNRACKRAGLENFRFHDLRHEAASRLFEKGLDIMEVASITGHKTLSTLRRYVHLKPDNLARKLG